MPKAKEKELKTPNISRFSAPFEVSYQYLFFLLRMYLYNTRNQVVAQAARGFESHPVRHKSTVILIELRWTFSMPENRLKQGFSVEKFAKIWYNIFEIKRKIGT